MDERNDITARFERSDELPSQLLIIDDDKALHALIRAELEPEGFHVHRAFGGRDGVNVAKATRPDLILLDVDMPDMDGFSVCDLIRIQEETSNTPVLFLSSNADPSERQGPERGGGRFHGQAVLRRRASPGSASPCDTSCFWRWRRSGRRAMG